MLAPPCAESRSGGQDSRDGEDTGGVERLVAAASGGREGVIVVPAAPQRTRFGQDGQVGVAHVGVIRRGSVGGYGPPHQAGMVGETLVAHA